MVYSSVGPMNWNELADGDGLLWMAGTIPIELTHSHVYAFSCSTCTQTLEHRHVYSDDVHAINWIFILINTRGEQRFKIYSLNIEDYFFIAIFMVFSGHKTFVRACDFFIIIFFCYSFSYVLVLLIRF